MNDSVKIEFDNLYVDEHIGDETVRLPIKIIPEMEEADGQHIHGYLRIIIGDEKIWSLGYFGEDDVCFNDWLGHLVGINDCFSKSSHSRFLFYDGGQGDSAFEFCRVNNLVYISHVDTEIYYSILSAEFFDSHTISLENEAHYVCDYNDFEFAVKTFVEQVKEVIFSELGNFASEWWQRNTQPDGRCSHINHKIQQRKGFVQN